MENTILYFLPSRVAKSIPDLGDDVTLGPEMIFKADDGFFVRGHVLGGPASGILRLLREADLTSCGSSAADGAPVVIVSRKADENDILITHHQTGENTPESELYPVLLNSSRDALMRFAAYTGLVPRMHFRATRVCEPFAEGDDSTIHFIVGASPPGAISELDRRDLCGVRLHPSGLYRTTNGPTHGRGFLIKDEHDQLCAQVLDRNVFLFTPRLTLETSALFSSEGGDLLLKILRLVSKALAEDRKAETEISLDSAEAYGQHAFASMIASNKDVLAAIKNAESEIERLRTRYHEALATHRHYIATLAMGSAILEGMVQENAESDWKRLSSNPLVEGLSVLDGALHVRTKPIIGIHEGRRYDYGPFMIRMHFRGTISIWALAPTHPRKLHHPHISERSSPCFGNAGLYIEEALESFRVADALELVLEWLVSGYDPALASVKIEEWPLYQEAA
ncbi:MAG: hypothetical protein WDN10_01050 [bacterium]